MKDRGSRVNFRNSRSEFRKFTRDPLSFVTRWKTKKYNSILIFTLFTQYAPELFLNGFFLHVKIRWRCFAQPPLNRCDLFVYRCICLRRDSFNGMCKYRLQYQTQSYLSGICFVLIHIYVRTDRLLLLYNT